jgi:hypothetical protein
MVRNWIMPGLALAALLAANPTAPAADPIDGSTSTLLGKGTAAAAARAADTEATWYHPYRRGFYAGFYAGVGYPYGYAVPYAVGYPAAVTYYTPAYIAPTVVAPMYVAPAYVPPVVGFHGRFGRFAVGIGVNGVAVDVTAPAIPLSVSGSAPAVVTQPAQPAPLPAPAPGINNPVPGIPTPMPMQKQDPSGQVLPNLTGPGLPVSLPKPPASKPYAFKAFGEK